MVFVQTPPDYFGVLPLFIFGYISYSYWDSYFWLKKGYEELVIDKIIGQLTYKKMGWKVFDEITGELEDVSNFVICPEVNELIEAAPRGGVAYGTWGGKICFWAGKKRYRFGVNLKKEEAEKYVFGD